MTEGLLRRSSPIRRVPALSRADVEDLFLVRTPLEVEAIRLLADRPIPAAAGIASSETWPGCRRVPSTASSSKPIYAFTGY